MKHLRIRVHGRVQGVLFRDSTRRKARNLNLKGFVRNERDGSVYVEVEGDEKSLNEFLDWCKSGSPLARVDSVDIEKGKPKEFDDFIIEY